MLTTTVARLRCPRRSKGKQRCGGELELQAGESKGLEVRTGSLACRKCRARFLILAGVAILVEDTREYLLGHVKGVSKLVPDSEIPRELRAEFAEAREEIESEHIEEDLEAERVNALYLMNHYLRVKGAPGSETGWWKPPSGQASPLIDALVREHWDQGPFARIGEWVSALAKKDRLGSSIELGCGVGGLWQVLKGSVGSYLGVDFSFASIALARHIALGAPYAGSTRIPGDLLQGSVSREVRIPSAKARDGSADFVVGDLGALPVAKGEWSLALALNAIDMLDDPAVLPRIQYELLGRGGIAIQSCPYVWHEAVSKALRARLPREIRDSANAVEWLYRQAGFGIEKSVEHVPWLFFKHARQLEIYSVHLFQVLKPGA